MSDFFPAVARLDLQGVERDMKKVLKFIYGVFESAIEDRRNRLATAGPSSGTAERNDFVQFLLELNAGNGDGIATGINNDEVRAVILVLILCF